MGAVKKRKLPSESSGTSISSKRVTVASERAGKVSRRQTVRKFRPAWLEVKGFKDWLTNDPDNPQNAKCKFCKNKFFARFHILVKHGKSKEHLLISGLDKPVEADFKIPIRTESKRERKKARAELKLVGLCADINVSFNSLQKIVNVFKSVSQESFLQEITLGRTKARDMLLNVISKCAKDSLDAKLRSSKFSICVDESTDRSKEKSLAIIVRFIDIDTKKLESKFWCMVQVLKKGEKANAGAERLFQCIAEELEQSNIPLSNVVGCCFDGCMTMIGEKSGLKRRLEDAIPGIVCVQCPAHSTHLCAQYAVKELPPEVVTFLSMIYNLLNSSHKLHDFHESQVQKLLEDLGFPQYKILKLCPTRWLILETCVDRVIQLWPVIIEFCRKRSAEKDEAAKQILSLMEKSDFRLYFLLLKKTLRELNSLNTLFQREDTVLHLAKEEIDKTYKNIVSCILKRDYVRDTAAADIDVFNAENYLKFIDFDLGDEVREALLSKGDDLEDFCKNAFNYIIEMALQMKDRFCNFMHPVYSVTDCLNIDNALSESYRQKNKDIFGKLMTVYKKLVVEEEKFGTLQTEWDNLPTLRLSKQITANKTVVQCWVFIRNFEINEGEKPFFDLATFVLDVLTTPHANADPERIFSDQNICKTKSRNKLDVKTVDASLRARQFIRSQEDFEPSEEMMKMALSSSLYTYKRKSTEQRTIKKH